MAPLNQDLAAQQFQAVAFARWAELKHSLKTVRGRLEVVSRVAILLSYTAFGIFAAIGAGFVAYNAARNHFTELIAGIF